jgi:DNA-binding response OmpR family regulator
MRILIIEDEKRLSDTIKSGLTEAGFAVDQAFDGEEGQFLADTEAYDLIILDIMLPKVDGLTVCKNLRNKSNSTPILILTAKDRVEDTTAGLDAGADDYLKKPFAFQELKSRIQALIRRSHNQPTPVLSMADLTLDPKAHTVTRRTQTIDLSPKEFSILEFLLLHPNQVVTRSMITDHVWDYNYDSFSNVIDVYIGNLRRKIDKNFSPKLIHTAHGVGFKLSEK